MDIREALKVKIASLGPTQFERLVGEVLNSVGISDVQVTGRSHDGGIDGIGAVPVLKLRVAFQAKRWNQPIGADPVRSFIGSVVSNRYDRGVFITASGFTPGAKEEAEKPDSRIVLVDGDALVTMMEEKGIGVTKVPVVRVELDEGFFAKLA